MLRAAMLAWLGCIATIETLAAQTADFRVEVTTPNCSNLGMTPPLMNKTVVEAEARVADWHVLVNNRPLILRMLEAARDAGLAACGRTPGLYAAVVSIRAQNARPPIVAELWWAENQWNQIHNNLPQLIKAEEQAAANKAAQEAEQLRQAAQQAANRAQLEGRRQAALADCGREPKFSGGPWFSSTYSVGANDEARRAGFFCVKRVDYISAAVHPLGGKAARAKFTGYHQSDFEPKVEVRDFPY